MRFPSWIEKKRLLLAMKRNFIVILLQWAIVSFIKWGWYHPFTIFINLPEYDFMDRCCFLVVMGFYIAAIYGIPPWHDDSETKE